MEGPKKQIIIEKGRIIIPRGKKKKPVRKKHDYKVDVAADALPTQEGGQKSVSSQTHVTFCTHECGNHPRSQDPPEFGKLDKKKPARAQGNVAQGSEKTKRLEGKSKEGNQKSQQPGNSLDQKKSKGMKGKSDVVDSGSETDSEGLSSKDVQHPDRPERNDKETKKKPSQTAKTGNTDDWNPAALPFLATLLPNTGSLSKQEKVVVEQIRQETRDLLTAARQVDEEQAQKWVAQQLASTHSGALQWLRERDVHRQTVATNAAFQSLAEARNISNQNGHQSASHQAPFLTQPLGQTPDPNFPLWPSGMAGFVGQRFDLHKSAAQAAAPVAIWPQAIYENIPGTGGIPFARKPGTAAASKPLQKHESPRSGLPFQSISGNAMHGARRTIDAHNDWRRDSADHNDVDMNRGQKTTGQEHMFFPNGKWNEPSPHNNQDDSEGWPGFEKPRNASTGMDNLQWNNVNWNQAPQASHNREADKTNLIVDENTGMTFHPAEPEPQKSFTNW